MSVLERIGRNAYRHRVIVVVLWVVILVGLGVLAVKFMGPTSSQISIPGTEAQKTLSRYSELFPGNGKGSGRIVFEAPQGKTVNDYMTSIADLDARIAKLDGVAGVVSPFDNPTAVSSDAMVAYTTVQLEGDTGSVSNDLRSAVSSAIDAARSSTGLTIESDGDLIDRVPGEIIGVGEIAGVVLALVVLVIALGSLVASGLPIATALVTVGVGTAGLFLLSRVIDVNSTTPALTVMLGLAVGIDYSLFIINRYKTFLLEGYSYPEAAGRALATAGKAVLFAAATVVIALSALAIVQIPFMTTMGVAGAAAVVIAALAAITLVPALLGLAGRHIFIGKTRHAIHAAQEMGPHHTEHVRHDTLWHRWAERLTRHPVIVTVVTIVVIGAIAWPVTKLQLGLPTDEWSSRETTQGKAYDLIAKGFGAGVNGPLLIVVEGLPAVTGEDQAAVRATIMQEYTKRVQEETAKQQAALSAEAATITTPAEQAAFQQKVAALQTAGAEQQKAALAEVDKQVAAYAPLRQLSLVADRIAKLDNVKQALPAQATDHGTKGIIQVIPDSAPSDQKTIDLISYLRDSSHQNGLAGRSGVTFGVTGSTAVMVDVNDKLGHALPIYLAVVVGLSFILLVIAFRSILVPIKATLGYLLSVGAMFGALVLCFQWGWFGLTDAPAPIVSFAAIIGIGVLFGLAMDYEFFMVSSMHEASLHTRDSKKAVVRGFSIGSKVVLAAGSIMVLVFAGFITNGDTTIQSIGFGLAVGIFVDAFLVRMTIVPAVMSLLGEHAWWMPKWLDRILPRVAIEGSEENVERQK